MKMLILAQIKGTIIKVSNDTKIVEKYEFLRQNFYENAKITFFVHVTENICSIFFMTWISIATTNAAKKNF